MGLLEDRTDSPERGRNRLYRGLDVRHSLYRAGGRRTHRPAEEATAGPLKVARWFLLGMSVLLVLAIAEAAGAVLKRMSHPPSGSPPGDVGSLAGPDPLARIATAPVEVGLTTQFPDPTGERELDVVVLGESMAEGVPDQNWLSVGQILKWQLAEILPDRPVRLEILAKSGEDLAQQHDRLARIRAAPIS